MKLQYKTIEEIFSKEEKEIYYFTGIARCRDLNEKTLLKGIEMLIDYSMLLANYKLGDTFFLHCLKLAVSYLSEEKFKELNKYKVVEIISAAPIKMLSEYRSYIEKIFDLLLNAKNRDEYMLMIITALNEKLNDFKFESSALELAQAVDELHDDLTK